MDSARVFWQLQNIEGKKPTSKTTDTMKDSINHALVITTLLERDIARICASGTGAQQIIAAKCAELRTAMANHLRYIQSLDRTTIIPSTPEQSEELHKLAERSSEINATQSKMTPLEQFDSGMDEIVAALKNAESREASAKAGDFNGDAPAFEAMAEEAEYEKHMEQLAQTCQFQGEPCEGCQQGSICDASFADIDPVSDKAYHADLIRRENVDMWRSYDRRLSRLGWTMAAIACVSAGVILAGIKIWFTYFQQ